VPKPPIRSLRSLRGCWNKLTANVTWLRLINDHLISLPLEPMLHASRWRLWWIGIFCVVGQLLFGLIWAVWLPQPWESLWLRLGLAILGTPLLVNLWAHDLTERRAIWLFSLICWAELPLFFSWMYLCNGGNAVWLASLAIAILAYHQLTDWRLATLGTALGWLLAWPLFQWIGPVDVPVTTEAQHLTGIMVIGFSWATALALGVSSANLRHEHLNHTLATMGIMAHELRTPLATMSLIGDALRGSATQMKDPDQSQKLDMLTTRLHSLVRHMNHQINTQIANARLLRLKNNAEVISAADVVRGVVHNYPYRSTRESDCVTIEIRHNFIFESSSAMFSQVLDNLLKNAFRSLAAARSAPQPGALSIVVDANERIGTITVRDQGIGIDLRLQARIFEPFFSTSRGTGHGLGLAFCRRVLDSVHGRISVVSAPGQGAAFILEIPRRA
jgi:two-component system CAI-1 autoinducer sensor kinase/phosphatase CqsS